MKAELNWIPGPPTKIGKCLLAIRGSEDAIPATLCGDGILQSWIVVGATYQPSIIAFHAAWPTFPYFRWPTIREYFDPQQENQKP